MSIMGAIGDALALPEPIFLDCYYSERQTVKRLLKNAGLNVLRCQYYNKGLIRKGLIVQMKRGDGAAARQVLAGAGYPLAQRDRNSSRV